MNEPLVSILTTTYRRPRYLRESLASAVGQSYRNLQIVVRDNASQDETPDVVRSFEDSRIEFLQSQVTVSAWENGAECVKRARGKYMFSLSDDDAISSNYIETLVDYMERDKQVLAAYGATRVIDESGAVLASLSPQGTVVWQAGDLIRAWCNGVLPLMSGINCLCVTDFRLGLGSAIGFPRGHNSDNAVFMTAGIRGKALFTDRCSFLYRKHSANSERSISCRERLQADREFLAYLDAEVNSGANTGLPIKEWPELRNELRSMLIGGYYYKWRLYQLREGHKLRDFANMLVAPMSLYEGRGAVAQFVVRGLPAIVRQTAKRGFRRSATVIC